MESGENVAVSLDWQRMVNLWASRFLEEQAQKRFICIVSCSVKHGLQVILGSVRLETGCLTLCYLKYVVFLLVLPVFASTEMP